MEIGGKKLRVVKACIGPTQMANFDVGIAAISGLASQTNNAAEQSRVLQLLNMVTPEELLDNDEYEGKLFLFSHPVVAESILIKRQKFPMMFGKNARNSVTSSRSKSHGLLAEAGNRPESERSSLSTMNRTPQRKHSRPWLAGSSQTGLWWQHTFQR
jgi:splicing factor U2AF subunit